jgi:hypothetical protein
LYRLNLFTDDSTRLIQVSTLEVDREYHVVGMERSGEKLLVSFVDSPDYISQVLLLRPHIFSDEDIGLINSDPNDFTLIY